MSQRGRLHFERVGAGPPMVLIHGRMRSSADWRRYGYVEGLADAFEVITIDVRGHGRSPLSADAAAYSLAAMEADALAVLDECGHERAAVFGYSMGGRIGFGLAAHHPARVTALVTGGAGPYGPPEGRDAELRLAATFDQGIGAYVDGLVAMLGGSIGARYRAELEANDAAAMAALSRGNAEWTDVRPSPDVPLLMFAGTADPQWERISAAAGALDAELHGFEGLGHMADLARSDLVLPVVRQFLVRQLHAGGE
ncbi:MAG: alpha/beta hydrolase [Actinomycetota bacterium]|nr:alpha/beta hydrolase [Actinomycetota bacterium]